MERFSSFLLILMLTEPVSSSFVSPVKAGKSPEEVLLVEGTSLRIKAFCGYQSLKGKKVWCKEKLKEDCYHNALLNSPGSEWKYLTTKSSEWIILEGSANGCISLLMSPLQVEDSGTYWFGIQDKTTFVFLEKINVVVHKSLPTPAKSISSPMSTITFSERPSKEGKEEEVMKMEGESLKIEVFCSQHYLQALKMWCKGDLLKECNPTEPVTLSGWKPLTTESNRRVLLKSSGNGCFSLLMSALKAEDSGTYWFGILDGLNVTPLRKIKVIIQKGQLNDNVAPIAENDKRAYQVILVLGSIVVGIIIIAALTLVVTMLIRKKTRATDDLNFGDNPNCRIITLQIRESNSTSNLPGKERNIVYAILKSPTSMTEDATYVNTKFPLKSSLNKHPNEQRPGVLSGSVKYANIIFGSRVPHSKD